MWGGGVEVTQDRQGGGLGSSLALPFSHLLNLSRLIDYASVCSSIKWQQGDDMMIER